MKPWYGLRGILKSHFRDPPDKPADFKILYYFILFSLLKKRNNFYYASG